MLFQPIEITLTPSSESLISEDENKNMRLDTDIIVDEFDIYFARAKSVERDGLLSLRLEGELQRASTPEPCRQMSGSNFRRAKSLKKEHKRRGSGKATPRKDLPTHYRDGLEDTGGGEEEEGGAGVSQDFRNSFRKLEVKCRSEPHSRQASWKNSHPKRDRSGSAAPLLQVDGLGGAVSPTEPESPTHSMSLEVPTPAYGCRVENSVTPPSSSPSPQRSGFRRRHKVDRKARIMKSRSLGTELYDETNGYVDSPEEPSSPHPEDEGASSMGGSSPAAGDEYHILVIGDYGVGKKSIVQHFKMKSLFSNPSVHDDVDTNTTIVAKIDGQHERIRLTVVPCEMHHTSFGSPDSYLIVYSVVDRSSFSHALDILHEIRRDQERPCPIIIAANKGDLARSRQVTEEEGKEVAKTYGCKFLEVSVVLNHQVKDLLNTSIKQIRHHLKKEERKLRRSGSVKYPKAEGKPKRTFIGKLFRSKSFATKSCDNLLTLS